MVKKHNSYDVFKLYFLIRSFTRAAGVFATNCLPFAPARFFLRAVEALCVWLRLFAFDDGRHLSGFFLFFEVPHGPLILPSVPIRTQFCFRQFASSPTFLFDFKFRPLALTVVRVFAVFRCRHVSVSARILVERALSPGDTFRTYFSHASPEGYFLFHFLVLIERPVRLAAFFAAFLPAAV